MALSGVVAPVHMPPEVPSQTALNTVGDAQVNVTHNADLSKASAGVEVPIKEEAMEVDEPKAGGDLETPESRETAIKTESEEGGSSLEQQQKQRERLPDPENEESRCSNSSTDDMWRPW